MTTGSRTILIVDDDVDIREALGQVLEDEGYRVRAAANGEEALSLLRDGLAVPHLILLDLAMPVMNGWQFRREQQRDGRLAEIPVVVISADQPGAEKAVTLAAAAHLPKPIELSALLETVARFC